MLLKPKDNQNKKKKPLGIYVHVPFCRSKCEYCDFYSLGGARNKELMDRYLTAVLAHIREAAPSAQGYEVDTVYFGGGTPSFFGAGGLSRIFSEIDRRFDVSRDAEVSFEANPDSVSLPMLTRLNRAGFNRISIGVQSDQDDMLKRLGRPHTYEQARMAVVRAREAGFANLSLDLMFGLPNQTLTGWRDTLENVLRLKPEHMSCYALKVEPNTPLWEYRDCANLPNDDVQADMYLAASEILQDHGYEHYEISNFAKPGFRSRHNLKYWQLQEYAGFGPGAHSDFGGVRYAYAKDLDAYIAAARGGQFLFSENTAIPPRERDAEWIMLGARTVYGLDPKDYETRFRRRFDPIFLPFLQKCEAAGYAVRENGRWHLTPKGFLVSNQIIGELLDAQTAEKQRRADAAARGDFRVRLD